MIVDTHCHAWEQWPYDRGVPDPQSRGSAEALLYEMDTHGVDHATIVCARIGGSAEGAGWPNADNNEYVAAFARRHPDRITTLVDVDSRWLSSYHRAGAADRLTEIVERTGAHGFTHYVRRDNDGWFTSDDGEAFFSTAESLGLIASLALDTSWLSDLDLVAERHPQLTMMLHHMSMPTQGPERESEIATLLGLAARDNIGVKISGFNYNSRTAHEYPYPDSQALFARIVAAFGAHRLYWGSDFPASRDQLTYTQALEVVRTHCASIGSEALNAILGGNASRLLNLTTTP